MKKNQFLSMLVAIVMVIAMLPLGTVLTYAANDPNSIKEVEVTLPAPKAGEAVDRSFASVTVGNPMEYKVVGYNWYKDNFTDPENDRLGNDQNDKYFVGGHSYTVRVDLEVKGDRTWAAHGDIHATVNGNAATVKARDINPDKQTICLEYTFMYIERGVLRYPSVIIEEPIAGKKPAELNMTLGNRNLFIGDSDYSWEVYEGGNWVAMDKHSDEFVAGKDYRVSFTMQIKDKDNLRFDVPATENKYEVEPGTLVDGIFNNKPVQYSADYDYVVTYTHEFADCKAQTVGSVSFGDIVAPVEGQQPSYTLPIMGNSTYELVTDDAVTGGAEYQFYNGIAWYNGVNPMEQYDTFEKGATYQMQFFIRTANTHVFREYVLAKANVGFVEVEVLDENLALVKIDFSPCGGGVMHQIAISDVEVPVKGNLPSYDFIYGTGYGRGDFIGDIVWYDVTLGRDIRADEPFVYGHQYELVIRLKSAKASGGDFAFAPHNDLKILVNRQAVNGLKAFGENPESEWVECYITFDCLPKPISDFTVSIPQPKENETLAAQLSSYPAGMRIEKMEWKLDGEVLPEGYVVEAGKIYQFVLTLSGQDGHVFSDGVITAYINGQEAFVVPNYDGTVTISAHLEAEEAPYCFISFNPGEGAYGSMSEVIVKSGYFTLPECEFTPSLDMRFLAWSVDGTVDGIVGSEYYVDAKQNASITFTALWESTDDSTHVHVYGDSFNYWDNYQHGKTCVSPNCPQLGDYSTLAQSFGHHYDMNFENCDATCEDCGYVRTTQNNGSPLHEFEFACSTTCWACGFTREASHTPGAPATCVDPQICTVCNEKLAPETGIHTPGAEADCENGQSCTVCGLELAPKKGHVSGVEWITSDENHWHICATCNGKVDLAAHEDKNEDMLCDVCGENLKDGLGVGAIIAIIVGSVAVLGGGGFCLYWFVFRKKKQ